MSHADAQTLVASNVDAAGLGLDLDDVEAHVAGWWGGPHDGVSRALVSDDPAMPPSCVLPRFSGERLRAEVTWPPHPRGTGDPWPAQARVSEHTPPGRIPLAYAWASMIDAGPWTWGDDDAAAPHRVIAAVCREVAAQSRALARQAPVGLAAPDSLAEPARQKIAQACIDLDTPVRLLPTALLAADAWCAAYSDATLGRLDKPGANVGSIIHLHMGVTHWSFNVLEVARQPESAGAHLVAMRRQPAIGSLPSFGMAMLHHIANRSLEMSYQQPTASRTWSLVWCTPWMAQTLAMLRGHEPGESADTVPLPLASHVRSPEFLMQQARQAAQKILSTQTPIVGLLDQDAGRRLDMRDIRDWLAANRQATTIQRLIGAVISGPMAAIAHDRAPMGLKQLEQVWRRPERVLIEGVDAPVGFLARRAAGRAAASQGE